MTRPARNASLSPAQFSIVCFLIHDLLLSLGTMPTAVRTSVPQGGIKSYYQAKIEAAELDINQKTQNLRRLEAQRNALNARGMYQLRPS